MARPTTWVLGFASAIGWVALLFLVGSWLGSSMQDWRTGVLFVLIALGSSLSGSFSEGSARDMWRLLRWPFGIAVLPVAFAALFKAAPNRTQPSVSWLSIGGVVAVKGMVRVGCKLVRLNVEYARTGTVVDRRVLMGSRMVERPTVQINLGRALALTASARAAVAEACNEVDRRIEARQVPDTADYYRQQAIVTMAVDQLSRAMDLLVATLGGNGLREGAEFERRLRDFRAMPLHINVHQDRISHQLGRLALGVELDPF